MSIVRGLWKSYLGTCVFGYCTCGREVRYSDEYKDEKCPMCKSKLEWKMDKKDLWIGKKNE